MSDNTEQVLNVYDIVEKYLTDNGYDGLAGDECGCFIGDLFPCGCMTTECVPGHKGNVEYDGEMIVGIAPGRKK